jgi:hypothetical protein
MGGGGQLRQVLAAAQQGTRRHDCRGGRLTEARWPGRSGAPNTMGKEAKQRGDHGGAHLGQQMTQRAVVVARGGGAAPSGPCDGSGSMRGSFGSKNVTPQPPRAWRSSVYFYPHLCALGKTSRRSSILILLCAKHA